MKKFNVAILGATGVVGQQMMECLLEQDFPLGELKLLASASSAGKTAEFNGQTLTIQEATPEALDGVDVLLGAAENDIALKFGPLCREKGIIFVDNSSAYRLDEDVPLVVPEINAEDIAWNNGIIANPNCSTIIGLVAVAPLLKLAGLQRMIVSTYQAASGAGINGLRELEAQMQAMGRGEALPEPSAFAYQLCSNLIPQIGGFNDEGYTSEEMKLQNEGRKILHMPELRIGCTCVRVPVMRSHSESINLDFDSEVTVEAARAVLAEAPGVKLVDDPASKSYPMPLDSSDQDLVYVGRIRKDVSAPEGSFGIALWCCGDQIRKGAASNAVQIAKLAVTEYAK